MVSTGADLLEREPASHGDRRRTEDRRAIAELTIPVGSPAVDLVPAGLATGMTEASAQPVESEAAGDRLGLETLLMGSVPDLPSAAVPQQQAWLVAGRTAGVGLSGR